MVTLREVADKAGVSLSTASRVVNGYKNVNEETRKKVRDYLGNSADAVTGAIRALMMSAAGTVIFPVQDHLGYGADTRINTPGRPHGNWCYRVTEEQLNSIDLEKFAYMNKIYARGATSLT